MANQLPLPSARLVSDRAREHGFYRAAVCHPSVATRDADAYRRWIRAGMHGEMSYMARPDRVARALDPCLSLAGTRSIVVVAMAYPTPGPNARAHRADPARACIASYGQAADYHDVMLARLNALGCHLRDDLGSSLAFEAMVDFRPLLERDAARRAGLGFVGRNTMLIQPPGGSWTFLGALLLNADLAAGAPGGATVDGTCGRCTRCLDACPTDAFRSEYVLDARRCISYLTIELKGPIPRALRPGIGNRVFGCDVCNEVCPYNRRLEHRPITPSPAPSRDEVHWAPPLVDLLALDEQGFAARFHGTPVLRAKRRGLLRNVCVALGNWGDPSATRALRRALGRIGTDAAMGALRSAARRESDSWVAAEISAALAPARRPQPSPGQR